MSSFPALILTTKEPNRPVCQLQQHQLAALLARS